MNEIRQSKRSYEQKLAYNIKNDCKSFYAYIRSTGKQNVRDKVRPLEDSAGNIISQGFLMAEDLNGYFSSVFTRENISSLPVLDAKFQEAKSDYLGQLIVTPEMVAKKIKAMISELRDLSYEEQLKEYGSTTLEARRLRGDLIEVFKILNGYENIDRNIFFSLKKDNRTRRHEVKLVKDQCSLDIRKYSFSQRTINE